MFSTLIVLSLLDMSFMVGVPLNTQKANHGIKVLMPEFSLPLVTKLVSNFHECVWPPHEPVMSNIGGDDVY